MGLVNYAEKNYERWQESDVSSDISSTPSYSIPESSFNRVIRMISEMKSSYEKYDSDLNHRSNWEKHIELVQEVYDILEDISNLSDDPVRQWQQLLQIKDALSSVCCQYEKYGQLFRGFLDAPSHFTRDSENIFQQIKNISDEISLIKSEYTNNSGDIRTQALDDFESFKEKLDADMWKIQTHERQHNKSKELWKQL